jgi:hypothetical protein
VCAGRPKRVALLPVIIIRSLATLSETPNSILTSILTKKSDFIKLWNLITKTDKCTIFSEYFNLTAYQGSLCNFLIHSATGFWLFYGLESDDYLLEAYEVVFLGLELVVGVVKPDLLSPQSEKKHNESPNFLSKIQLSVIISSGKWQRWSCILGSAVD